MEKVLIALGLVLFLCPVVGAFDSTGTADADTCSGNWTGIPEMIWVTAFVTPDIANLVADSGLIFFHDGYDDTDSAVGVIYNNAGGGGEPGTRVAYSDTVFTDQAGCIAHSVMYNQEAIGQNDSIWLGLYAFGVPTDITGKLGASTGAYYELTPGEAADPWDVANDTYDGATAPSVRLYLSTAAADGLSGRRRIIIIGGGNK